MKKCNCLNKKPMVELLAAHLKSGKSITAIEANALWRCRSLSRRICDLKDAGYKIQRQLRRDTTGQRYARYFLAN